MTTTPVTISAFPNLEEPIRAELFSVERLEQHAESLAAAQTVTVGPSAGRPLIARAQENGRVLLDRYRAIADAIQHEQSITPAAEWLIDNFYIVEEQLREIRDDLPIGFYRKLPKLNSGPFVGYPRVFGVAWAYVAHTDSSLDPDLLARFIKSYQRVQPLSIGELWAVTITLRIVLVENLRRIAEFIMSSRTARIEADALADRLLGTPGHSPVAPADVLRQFEKKPLERAFAVQLIQRLRDLDPKVGPILLWLDERLAEQGTTADEIVRAEHQQQAAMSVSVRNIITSMRLTSAFDWKEFFESVSLVDEIMRNGSSFAEMDFATRDHYRHAIEDLSRGSRHTELEVAERAVRLARQAKLKQSGNGAPREERRSDPGFYLLSRGRKVLEQELGFRVSWRRRLLRLYVRAAVPGYLGSIAILTAMILAVPLLRSFEHGIHLAMLILVAVLAAVPASDLAIALINRAVAELLGPQTLPRLELRTGIPEALRTMIVVPTLLVSPKDIREQVERLEIHYLSNPDGDLRFALLSDWLDAPAECVDGDDELLAVAAEGIEALNQRHGPAADGKPRFYLFHRKRLWNASEQKWMGWERKRGKLHELNRFLRGTVDTTFIPVAGNQLDPISGVRYVITLDADTRLPRGAVVRLVGTMAHPLNRPIFSAEDGRVVDGYALVQPRITPALPSDGEGTIFHRIFVGPSGLDPYASAVSDVYQDLFHEGSYTGKGIYDLEAFEGALADKVQDNTLLSHDLFEGIFARAALATDIELVDDFPSHFETAAVRQHRWARGDWQLLPWILGWKSRTAGAQRKIKIPAISRWKMIDNLRRTLSAPFSFLTLLVGWLDPRVSPLMWTLFILATISIPSLIPFFSALRPRLGGISKRSHFRGLFSDLTLAVSHIALSVTFLAYQTWLMSDAIVRTFGRLFVTHRNLLEWVTAAQAKHAADLRIVNVFRRMFGSLILAAVAFALLMGGHHYALPVALPFIALWSCAPGVAWWISLPPHLGDEEPLSEEDAKTLRLIARRTWRFFEVFVSNEENQLPPDNFQEDPKPVVAHRTSPTNIGLYLLSTLAARDFAWVGVHDVAHRLEGTFTTIDRLEKYRGHLYNWYDTRSLRPLDPKYVSSVDSGNLAGHYLVVSNGCRELLREPALQAKMVAGVQDSIDLLREALTAIEAARRPYAPTRRQLHSEVEGLQARLHEPPANTLDWAAWFVGLREHARTVADIAQTLNQDLGGTVYSELHIWAEAIRSSIEAHAADFEVLIPWLRFDPQEVVAMSERSHTDMPEWVAIEPHFRALPSLINAPESLEAASAELATARERVAAQAVADPALLARFDALAKVLKESEEASISLNRRLLAIAHNAEKAFHAMDFGFLYDHSRMLFSIGFRASDGGLDSNCYDLLASEARLTSFIAMAKGDVPPSHWFHMARPLTPVGRGSALVSWSGSMFEYLMPALVMTSPADSLLGKTYEQVLYRQIEYGAERGVPWGISESAYNARDIDLTYQYSSFGIPGLGLKRGLSEDLVIAPYAAALATMVDTPLALKNLERIFRVGGRGDYGFYEALDYTSSRLRDGETVAIVRNYMAHHQGMSLLSFDNALNDGIMRRRFHAEPMVQATELVLQERMPRNVLVARPRAEEVSAAAQVRELNPPILRTFTTPHHAMPQTQLLSNGRYAVMLTAAGSGYSRWSDLAITRWREDLTRDCWGAYFYLRDENSGKVWSAGYQPTGAEPDAYEAAFHEDHAEFTRRDGSLTTSLEVVVSSEDDAEVRRISLTNMGSHTREIQVTSYAEVCLTSQATDAAHPAFSNLFVETEYVEDVGALLATRRRRSEEESTVWMAHLVVVEGETSGDLQFESDRARFVGRTRTLRNPLAIADGQALSNTVGPVLDPIMSMRRSVRIPPGGTVQLMFSTMVASTREEVLQLAEKYRDARSYERTRTLAWTQTQVQLRHLGIDVQEAQLFQKLANVVLFSDPSLRPASEVLSQTRLNLSTLWAQGISGDLPIILARIDNPEDLDMVRQLLRAHEYWRMKQLSADVVIINEKAHSYVQELQVSLEALVRGSQLRLSPNSKGASGSIFLLRGDLIPQQTRMELQAVARIVLLSRRGTLAEQIMRSQFQDLLEPDTIRTPRLAKRAVETLPQPNLQFFNGLGGFADNGREYVTVLGDGARTPEPWVNVIANPSFGFLVSESGSGFTWSLNSHENQLTTWSNDHLFDTPAEALYIRDDNSGEIWSPTALPVRDESATYIARHGQGYSRFEHLSHGIKSDLLQFVPKEDPIKISKLTLQNDSARTRRISVTAYAEWVLGSSRSKSAPYLITEIDPKTGAVFARSAWEGEFGKRIAFADLAGKQTSCTADRREFLGRNGTLERPAALDQLEPLSGTTGAGLDSCAALQTSIELRPGARAEIVFFLGQTEDREQAQNLLLRYRSANIRQLLSEATSVWDDALQSIQVTTPDPAMDVLLNRWLLYQTLVCRVWARAAFYQLSGAYGFRDQIQDVMALSVARRDVAREHLLRAAGRQFVEGDVQHWWHPTAGRGIRTRMSDDLLWLPYAVVQFMEATGDSTLLDEIVPFLEGETLAQDQKEAYFLPRTSDVQGTVFEHCARALDRSLNVGSHGLPLMGTGDWNDGMNRVGQDGKGESVWLGWFLHTVLWEFAKVAAARGEHDRAEKWRLHVSALKAALEREGWDGEWYRRAYYDDGTPLGSASNDECRIDSIAQTWGVMSGAAEPGRGIRAMAALDHELIRRPEGLILLLTPPFDKTSHDPGYIKGYVPGIRENGGQYTHASTWALIAFASLGDGDKAAELFRMMNPIHRASSRATVRNYKVEPYVVAGDIYAETPHVGRGGWTWYTGSAGWLYRGGMEWILGVRVRGQMLHIDPCIPRSWPGYSIRFRYHSTVFDIKVENPSGVSRGVSFVEIDDSVTRGPAGIPLVDDGSVHKVRVVLG